MPCLWALRRDRWRSPRRLTCRPAASETRLASLEPPATQPASSGLCRPRSRPSPTVHIAERRQSTRAHRRGQRVGPDPSQRADSRPGDNCRGQTAGPGALQSAESQLVSSQRADRRSGTHRRGQSQPGHIAQSRQEAGVHRRAQKVSRGPSQRADSRPGPIVQSR